jgi:outer membrane protein
MKEYPMRLKATPLALATALALTASPAFAVDLMQSYAEARKSDPTLAISESQNVVQKEGVVQARSNLLPQINGQTGRTRTKGESTFQPENTSTSRNTSINLSQSVFDWSDYTRLNASKARAAQSDAELDSANDALMTRVSEAYFNVLTAIDALAASRAEERAVKRQLDQAEKRLEVGLAPITDVHEAKARYDSSRANSILAGNALNDAREALAEITGQASTSMKGLPDGFQPKAGSSRDTEEWVQDALRNNPTVKARELALAAAEDDIASAKAAHLPTLESTVSYGDNAVISGSAPAFNPSDSNSTSIGVQLRVPIFSGFATQSRVRQAVATRDIAAEQLEQSKRTVTRQVRNADRNLVAGLAEVEARRLAVVSAKSALEAGEVGLEVGTRTIVDVLLAQQQLFTAAREYSRARHNYLVNTLKLKQAAGSLEVADLEAINALLVSDAEAKIQ